MNEEEDTHNLRRWCKINCDDAFSCLMSAASGGHYGATIDDDSGIGLSMIDQAATIFDSD